jgi:hypothetical protein
MAPTPPPPTPAVSTVVIGVRVGGEAWYDVDKDGQRDWGEPALAGVTVSLHGANGTPLRYPGRGPAVVTTGVSGTYSFVVAPHTSYQIRFDPPGGGELVPTDARSMITPIETGADGTADTTVDAGFFRALRPTLQRLVNGARDADRATVVPLGSTVRLSYIVTNRDSSPLSGIEVVDDSVGTVDCPDTRLAPHATMTCEGRVEAQPGLDIHEATLTARVGGSALAPVVITGRLFTQVRLEVRKVDEDQTTPLEGAVFEVRDGEPSGPTVARITTGRTGVAAAPELDAGPRDDVGPKRYCVVEVEPPAGYDLAPHYLTGQCAHTNAASPLLAFSVSDPVLAGPRSGGQVGGDALRSWLAASWLLLLFGVLVLIVLAVVARRSSRMAE